jgi:hypothetical protein
MPRLFIQIRRWTPRLYVRLDALTPDGSQFFFSGLYFRDTMSNSVFFFSYFGSIFKQFGPGHWPQKSFFFEFFSVFSGYILPGLYAKFLLKNDFKNPKWIFYLFFTFFVIISIVSIFISKWKLNKKNFWISFDPNTSLSVQVIFKCINWYSQKKTEKNSKKRFPGSMSGSKLFENGPK